MCRLIYCSKVNFFYITLIIFCLSRVMNDNYRHYNDVCFYSFVFVSEDTFYSGKMIQLSTLREVSGKYLVPKFKSEGAWEMHLLEDGFSQTTLTPAIHVISFHSSNMHNRLDGCSRTWYIFQPRLR